MKCFLRYLKIALLSALVAGIPYTLFFILLGVAPLGFMAFVVAYAIAFLTVVFVGVPLHFYLQKLKKYEARYYLVPGFLLPCGFVYVIEESMGFVTFCFGLTGLAVSGVFWWLAVRKNPFSSNKLRA